MRWGALSSFLKDPWVLVNLALRLVLWAIVLRTHGYLQDDSNYYLENARTICEGAWGGDSLRTPMYGWLLCASTFFKLGQIELTLFLQTLAVWFSGLILYKRNDRLPAFLWLFDPVLLAYSNLVMTDALFALAILGLAHSIRAGLNSEHSKLRPWLWVGLCSGVAILLRPIGMPFIVVTWAVLAVFLALKKIAAKPFAFSTAVLLLVLSPVLFWNYSQSHRWYLANQGGGWIQSVAGIVQYRGSGLDFIKAEIRWHDEHPGAGNSEAFETLKQHWPSWMLMSMQGMARVLFGNINTEYTAILTGQVPLGPGWFKEGTENSPNRVKGMGVVFWGIGALGSLIFAFAVYFIFISRIYKARSLLDSRSLLLLVWILISAAVLVAVPQVFGDIRFRVPVWALLVTGLTLVPIKK